VKSQKFKSKARSIARYLFCLILLALPFYVVRFNIGPIPTTVLEVLIYLAFIAAIICGDLKEIKNKKAVSFGLLFVLAGLLAAFLDPNQIRGLGLWKAYFFDGYLIFLLVLSYKNNNRDLIKNLLIFSGALTAVLAIMVFLLGTKTADGRIYDLDRLSPNYLAMYLMPIFVMSGVVLGQKIKARKGYLFSALSGLFIIVALILTQSRGSLVAVGGVILVAAYIFARRRKTLGVSLKSVFWIALILFFASVFYLYRPDFTDHARKATSSNIRYYIWSTSLEMAKRKPFFGVGLGNYQDYFSDLTKNRVNYPEFISPQALTAHNLYLHFYLVAGVLGLASFILLLVNSRFWLSEDFASLLALVTILFYGLVDTPIFRNDLSALFWIILALTSSDEK